MASQIFKLSFPKVLIKKPVIWSVSKKFNIIPNIRRAQVTENEGWVVLEFEGKKSDIEKAVLYMKKIKVEVEPIVGDIVE
jgi:ABC-type methionine transport system ATPase subunit